MLVPEKGPLGWSGDGQALSNSGREFVSAALAPRRREVWSVEPEGGPAESPDSFQPIATAFRMTRARGVILGWLTKSDPLFAASTERDALASPKSRVHRRR
jgi:hypothetical protein